MSNGHLTSTANTLYSQVQRIYLKSRKGEEKSMNLRINIEIKTGATVSSEKVRSINRICCIAAYHRIIFFRL